MKQVLKIAGIVAFVALVAFSITIAILHKVNPAFTYAYSIEVKHMNGALDTVEFKSHNRGEFCIRNAVPGLFSNSGTIPFLVYDDFSGFDDNAAFDVIKFKILTTTIKNLK